MDGEHTVRDLVLAYFDRYGRVGLEVAMQAMLDLHAAGFVRIQPIGQAELSSTASGRLLSRAALWTSHEFSLPHVDRVVGRLYQWLLRPLYSRLSQVLLAALALAGVGVFIRELALGQRQLAGAAGTAWLATLVAYLVLVPVHELAHASTCKHFGRKVRGLGIGWYLFVPTAFADTSDIWMEGKLPRMAVAWAGPYANFVIGGLASLLTLVDGGDVLRAGLSQIAALAFILGLLNLNPPLESDGYCLLADWLDMPNFRTKALAYLGAVLWHAGPPRTAPRVARLYVVYGVLALCYTTVLAGVVLGLYQQNLQALLRRVIPGAAAGVGGWLIAGLVAFLILHSMWTGLRAGRSSHEVTESTR